MEECDDGEEGGRRGTGNFRVGDEGRTLSAPVPKRVCIQNGRQGFNLDPIRVPPRDSSLMGAAATFRGRRLVEAQTSRGRDLEWVQAVGDRPRCDGRGEWVSPAQPIMAVTPDTRLMMRSVQQPRVGTNFFAPRVKDVGRDARGGSMQSDDQIGGGVRLLTALTEASGLEDLGSSGYSQVSGERAERGYSLLLETVGRGPRRKGAFASPASRKDRPLGGEHLNPTRSQETRRARRVLTEGSNMVTRSRGRTGATSGGSVGGEDGGAASSSNQSGVVSGGGGCVGEPYSYKVGQGLFPFGDLVAGPQVVRADKDKLIEAMERAISNEDDFMKSNADVDCVFVELTENLETALVEASGCMVTLGSNRTKFNFSTVREEVVVYVQYMLPWHTSTKRVNTRLVDV